MKYGVRLKIDVSKIDKSKLFAGKKGHYLDATVFLDVDNKGEFGDNGMITQDAPKGEQGAILGNATVFWNDGPQSQQQGSFNQSPVNNAPAQGKPMSEPNFDDDLAF